MKFGKLTDISKVDFSLPEDHPATERILGMHGLAADPKVYLGATGWGNKEWLGKWYPTGTKPVEFLRHYSKQFGTLEFNSTHYRIPTLEQIGKWKALAAPGFKFCPKVPQQISHRQRLLGSLDPTERFVESVRALGEHLGPVFMQMPENYAPLQAPHFEKYLREWPSDVPLHLEFRHPDFFQENDLSEMAFHALEESGQGTVLTDVAGRRDVLNMRLSNPVLVLRFVGNALHPTDYERAAAWAERLKKWIGMGLKEAYLFIHQPEMELVPEYTKHWAKLIKEVCGVEAVAPALVEEARQGRLF